MNHQLDRRQMLKLLALGVPALSGCALARYSRIDPMHVLIRSDVILDMEQEAAVVSRAKLDWTPDGRIRVLYVRGTPYERGYQQGKLLRSEIQDNLGYLWEQSLKKFRSREIFSEVYERLRPFIPQDYIDEMHGLAHGARMDLEVIHGIHALPEMTEWGGKKRIKKIVQEMMDGELATSCSNLAMGGGSTADGKMYVVRILDWGLHRISKLHEYPLITVNVPDKGIASANIGWVGFLGAISGMNEQGITLGEMGYGDDPDETLRGVPMPFVLRDVLTRAASLKDVREIIKGSPGTNRFIFLMSDGKSHDAELYVRDRRRFLVFRPGEEIKVDKNDLKAYPGVVYGGHYPDRMQSGLDEQYGKITPDLMMKDLIPKFAMRSNFQNVLYAPTDLKFWVANAAGSEHRAAEQPYTLFDFGAALKAFRS